MRPILLFAEAFDLVDKCSKVLLTEFGQFSKEKHLVDGSADGVKEDNYELNFNSIDLLFKIAIAVVDSGGHIVIAVRQDDVPFGFLETAIERAKACVSDNVITAGSKRLYSKSIFDDKVYCVGAISVCAGWRSEESALIVKRAVESFNEFFRGFVER